MASNHGDGPIRGGLDGQTGDISCRTKGSTRKGRFKAFLDRLLRHPVTDGVVMAAVLVSVVLLLVEMQLPLDSPAYRNVELAGYGFILFFVVELSLRWYVSPSTRRFFTEYWIDVLAVIPFFRPARALRLLRFLRFLRALRLLRMYRFGLITQRLVRGPTPEYEEKLREEVAHYRGRCCEQVWLVPELYRLFSNLLEDGRVHPTARTPLLKALAYFITPYEVFSLDLLGPEGYLDQVFVSLHVLDSLQEELPLWLMEEAWEGEGTLAELLEEELPLVREELEEDDREAVKRYLGLDQT